MIALHRGICPKNGTGKVFKGKGSYPADTCPVTNFILYSKMVYSASLRFLLPQSRWTPLSVLCVPSAIRQVGLGGKGEIRTLGPFRIVGFQDRWFKPLTHLTLLPSGEGYCCFVCLCAPRFTALVAVSPGNPPGKASCEFQSVADADCDTGVEISERASA